MGRKKKCQAVRLCAVCGDAASGFNFNALSCGSCKAFFRRHALRNPIEIYCPFTNNCPIDAVRRKFCTKCRLDKCLQVGMKKEWILTNTDKYLCKRKILLNRLEQVDLNTRSFISETQYFTRNTLSNSSEVENFPQESWVPEASHELNYASAQQDLFDIVAKIKKFLHNSNEKQTMKSMKITSSVQESNELQHYDLVHLEEIQQASAIFVNENKLESIGETDNLALVAFCEQHYVRKAIKFCTKISAFKSLSSNDQLCLLKAWYPEFTAVRLAFYHNNSGSTIVANEDCSQTAFFKLHIFPECTLRRFIVSMSATLYQDVVLRDLIFTLLLFKNHAATSHEDYVRYHYCLYSRLLYKYLRYKFGQSASKKFDTLIQLINEADMLRKTFRRIYTLELGVNQVNELFVELFDLNGIE